MRYSLRNHKKISETYGDKFLIRLLNSLNEEFQPGINRELDIREVTGEPYSILTVDDTGHSCGLILFYVISKTYDVYNLAFKEVIN